jgi:probable HAF family extracellular repeat protein
MRQRIRTFRGPLLLALLLAVVLPAPVQAAMASPSPSPAASDSELEVVDLGVLPGDIASFAHGINDHGAVVGTSTGEAASHAFLWRRGRMVDLGTLGGGPSDNSNALAIDERGRIVGWSNGPADDFAQHAVLWRNGEIVDLGTLGGPDSVATDINDRGEVVGYSTTSDGSQHAFLWRRGRMIDLGTPDGQAFSYANAINDDGQVVGGGYTWQDGEWTPLEPPAGAGGVEAQDNNDRNQVAGYSLQAGIAVNRAVVWNDGAPRDLGFPEDEGSQAMGINDHGQVVGSSFDNGAFLWEHGEITYLPSVAALASAEDINERGQVAGYSPTMEGIDPRYHAVVWR